MYIIQITAIASKLIPTDKTLDHQTHKSSQLSVLLGGERYVLVRRLGRVFDRTNKDVTIDLLYAWLETNIGMPPAEEQERITKLLEERRSGLTISNRKPQ